MTLEIHRKASCTLPRFNYPYLEKLNGEVWQHSTLSVTIQWLHVDWEQISALSSFQGTHTINQWVSKCGGGRTLGSEQRTYRPGTALSCFATFPCCVLSLPFCVFTLLCWTLPLGTCLLLSVTLLHFLRLHCNFPGSYLKKEKIDK